MKKSKGKLPVLFLQRAKTKSTIDPQIIPLRVYLGWMNSQLTQHFHTMFKRKYRLISSNVATTNTQCHEKALRARTRGKVFHNFALRTK